ncbi:MAG TPA: MBL fold metallo-hydrolase [Candidatus Binataceae bacterium]|nr:MBL fold metallo-hydrolase [Candidatus Binataceae bacterium]
MKLTMLGTGDAFASRGRFQAGYVIEVDGRYVLMEAGPTLLASMKRTEIAPADLDYVLISHLHGDHFAGLPFLILEYLWESPRKRTLTIAGPKNLERRVWSLFGGMYPATDASRVAKKLKFVVLEPGRAARVGPMRIETVRTPHTKPDVSLAMRITAGNRVLGFSGDSGWTDSLTEISSGTDVFLCECTYFESAHLDFHLNYPIIERNRDRFGAERIVLTHLGREALAREREIGMEMATDLMRIDV